MILNYKNTFFKSVTTLTLTSTLLFASIDGYMTTYFVNGDGLAGGTSGTHATVKYFPTPTNQNSDTSVVKDIATNAQTGAAWGMAYDTRNKDIYVSAAVKRHVGLGSQGIGGIYKIDISDIDNPSVSNFTTVSNAGSILSNSDRHLPADSLDGKKQYPSRDPIFEEVGTMGLGDIDISSDGTKLYTMNLNTQSLIEIDIASKSQTSYAVGDPFGDCGTAHVRPWAINTQNNEVHIGAICDNDLTKGSVVAKLNSDGSFTAIAQQSLVDTDLDAPDYRSSEDNVNHLYPNEWLTRDDMSTLFNEDSYSSYSQLILTDITFDKDNSLVLGFADRSGLQAGYGNYGPDSNDDTLYNIMSAGDVQKMCLSGGTYYTEGTSQCPFKNEPVDSKKNEYFVGDAYYDNDDGKGHREVSLGGLAYDSTTDVVAVTVYDPVDDSPTYTAGAIFLKNSDGTKHASQLFAVGSGGVDRKISMGKAGGVGDIEALETAPLAYILGDKVWIDENENGLQDAGEDGVNDVTVNLYSTVDCTGSITKTIKTANGGTPAADGFYQFTNLAAGDYCVEFKDLPADYLITTDAGADDTKNSDADTTGKIKNISLNADDPDEDMGIYKKLAEGICWAIDDDTKTLYRFKGLDVNNPPAVEKINISRVNDGEGLAYRASTNELYMWDKTTTYIIDADNGNDIRDFSASYGGEVEGATFYIDPDTQAEELWITREDKGTGSAPHDRYLEQINPEDGTVISSVKITGGFMDGSTKYGKDTGGLAIDPDTKQFWITDDSGSRGFYKLNNSTGEIGDGHLLDPDDTALDSEGFSFSDNGNFYTESDQDSTEEKFIWQLNKADGTYQKASQSFGPGGKDNPDIEAIACNAGASKVLIEPKVDIEKATNSEDADTAADAVQLTVGDNVTWSFVVTNNGKTDLDNIAVSDDKEGDVTCPKTTLAVKESMTCDSISAVAAEGNYTNIATVTAKEVCDTAPCKDVNDTDPSYYEATENIEPSIDIEKATNTEDADTVADAVELKEDDNVTWSYVVTNTGNVDLDNIAVVDDQEGNVTCPSTTLSAGANMTCTAKTALAIAGDYVNNAKVTAKEVCDTAPCTDVNDTDSSHYKATSYTPSIDIEKATNGSDADTVADAVVLKEDDNVTWSYVVTNTGDIELKDISVVDDEEGTVTCPSTTLAVGEDMTCTAKTALAVVGDYVNNATVTGKESCITAPCEDVNDTDPSHYKATSYTPSIDVEKATNTEDADTVADAVELLEDENVTWSYVVTNTGDIELKDISVVDDKEGAVTCPSTTLAVGANMTCTSKTGVAIAGNYVNNATVTGKEDCITAPCEDVNDTDPSHYVAIERATIGDKVWNDTNANGIQDGTEVGVKDITVTLYDSSCSVIATDENGVNIPTETTDNSGNYLFTDLPPSDYCLGFTTLPAGYAISPQNRGGDDAKNSDVNVTSGKTVVTTLIAGEDDRTWDMGIYEEASIGNFVWNDINANGEQEGTEAGVEDVTVTLYKSDCSTVATTNNGSNIAALKTDANGLYKFKHLMPAEYCLGFTTLPNGFGFTFKDTVNDAKDSDVDTATGKTISTTLDAGEDDITWDAGIYESASIGDRVWNDTNANGVQDTGENGVENVTVVLYQTDCTTVAVDGLGVAIPNKVTVTDGSYSFTGLVPDDYCVGFDLTTLPAKYKVTPLKVSSTTADKDSNVNETTGKTESTNLVGGENDTSWDMGIYPLAEIGDRVWDDENANGVQDATESGVAGVIATLYGSDCTTIAKGVDGVTDVPTVSTSAHGEYKFTELPVGDYCVGFSNIPNGYKVTPQDKGGDDAKDSDVKVDTNRTVVTTLDANESDMSWDMGIFKPATIGDKVWNDVNANGVQDAGEVGVQDVTVTLYDSSCNVVATDENGANIPTQTTNASGNYLFTDLPPADYCLGFTNIPTGYAITPQDKGGDDATDSDVNVTSAKTVVTTLDPAEDDRTWDMGIYEEASIGNFVWNDINGNGEQEGTEVGVEDVTVTLYKADCTTVATTNTGSNIVALKTDVNGLYKFENLMPAEYCLGFTTLPNGFGFTFKDTASDLKDSDVDATTGKTISTVLDAGEDDMTWDAGIFESASIGDKVWYDNDANGIQDVNEKGVDNVTVTLYQSDCTTVAVNGLGVAIPNTKTATDGSYSFSKLVPSDYCVGFNLATLPAGYKATFKDQGADDAKDSDANDRTGKTTSTNLVGGENDTTWDMGIYPLAEIGDKVWNDVNANGVQDSGESGVTNVTVTLYGADCTARAKGIDGVTDVPTINTSASGEYKFIDLSIGSYCVGFTNLPNGFEITSQDRVGDDTIDSDARLNTAKTIVTTLDVNESDMSWDMGIYQPATIGDKVWNDSNANGIQDATEVGVKDVTVTLYDSSCTVVATDIKGAKVPSQKTDTDGNYLFTTLPPADYCLEFTTLPEGYAISPQGKGGDSANDSDVNVKTARTVVTTLSPGEDDRTWDMGIYEEASIGNYVWNDINGNGKQEGSEVGVANVTVTLYKADCSTVATNNIGENIATLKTDANGLYKFEHLMPSEYCLGFTTLPNGFGFTAQDIVSDVSDSDVGKTTGKTISTVLDAGEDDMTWDAGIFESASIGDKVWYDNNANGVQEADEKGVANVTVTLYQSDCTTVAVDGLGTTIPDAKTTSNGNYMFSGLVPGDYCVGFNLETLPNGYRVTTLKSATTTADRDSNANKYGKAESTNLLGGEDDKSWDMGIYKPATIGNFVWLDKDADGVQDENEGGVANVMVRLYSGDCTTVVHTDSSGVAISPVVTGDNGLYEFNNLVPAEYCVGFEDIPTYYVVSPINQGNDLLDSDVNPTTKKTVSTLLESGERDESWDMGLYIPATIGDRVWIDKNADGIQDKNESGIADITVTLYESDCRTAVLLDNDRNKISPITTDSDGFYNFVNLIPNDYCIGFSNLPEGYLISSQDVGTDNNDSDADIVTARTVRTTLSSGENDGSWDMGIYRPASIGDRVWNDLDGNGEQDSGEEGVADVNVTLYNCDCTTVATDKNGTVIPSTLTDENGLYSFSDLTPNNYCLGFTVPTGYIASAQNSGEDDSKDSDVNADTNRTECTTLSSDENDTSWDMGIIIPASIGDRVWIDANRDGVQDSNESGLKDVNVTLYEADCSTAIKSMLTGKKGNYLFSDLLPNSYCIGIETPNGYAITPMDATEDSKDSDVNEETGRTIVTTLESGENDLTWDAGLYELSSIGDYVWFDEDHDGIQDSNETAVPNVKVILYESDCETEIKVTRSGTNGHYLFENLEPAEYCVGFDELPTGYQFTPSYDNTGAGSELDCNVDPGTGKTPIIELAHATNDLTWDMGIIPKCKDEEGRSLQVFDDVFIASTTGPVTTLNVLENDFGNLDIESIEFVTSEEAAILWENGTAVGGVSLETVDRLVVPGEGVWEVKSDGTITFTAEVGFDGVPTPVYYVVRCKQGSVSNIAQATITGNCVCETYSEQAVDTLNNYGMFLMLMLTSTFALLLFRKEFEKSVF